MKSCGQDSGPSVDSASACGKAVRGRKSSHCQDTEDCKLPGSSAFISSPASQGQAGGSEADASPPAPAALHLNLEKRLLPGLLAFFRKSNEEHTLRNREAKMELKRRGSF